MNCETCKENRPAPVPYIVFESEVARLERIIKRLWITIVILVLMLGAMFIYEASWVDEETTIRAYTDDGGTAIANASGEVFYGDTGDSYNETPNP